MSEAVFPAVLYVHYFGMVMLLVGALVVWRVADVRWRQRAAYLVAAPGFIMAWGGGHISTEFMERELFSVGMVVGFLALTAVMNGAHWWAARGPGTGWSRDGEGLGLGLNLKTFGYVEGASLVGLLFVAMPFRYLGGIDEPVRYVGMIHGVLFMVFVGWVMWVGWSQKWRLEKVAGALAASVIPFAPYVADLAED